MATFTSTFRHDNLMILDTSYLMHYAANKALKEYEKYFGEIDDKTTFSFESDKDFMGYYQRNFGTLLSEIRKIYDVNWKNIFIALDCKRANIWRKSYFEAYKANRDVYDNNRPNFSQVFKYTCDILIPTIKDKMHTKVIGFHVAEGDDIIAVTKKYFRKLDSTRKIIICANDCDYLQIVDEHTLLANLDGSTYNNKTIGSPKKDLIFKIIIGDRGDNIGAIFDRCGKVTGEKLLNNMDLLKEKLQDQTIKETFIRNKKLIDFNEIPEEVQQGIIEVIEESLNE